MRTAVLGAVGVTAAVAGALGLVFWVLLAPAETSGCDTSLPPGAYADAMLPAHVGAVVALGAAAAWLDAGTADDGRVPRHTRIALAIVAAVAAVCAAVPAVAGLLGLVAVFAAPLLGVPLGLVVAIRETIVVLRRPAAWHQHAVSARVLVWGSLVLGVPGHLAYAWLAGANPFCF